jgi:hypothetical protein
VSCYENVESDNNVIVSGNLNATLYVGDKICDESTTLFENVLWELGYCAIETFTVKNDGSLVFKYQFKLDIESLSQAFIDSLRVAVIDNYSAEMSREDVLASFENIDAASGILEFSKDGVIEAAASDTFTVAVYFVPELSGNVAQEDVKDCKFDASIAVTQYSAEEDGFGNEYDQDAVFEDAE